MVRLVLLLQLLIAVVACADGKIFRGVAELSPMPEQAAILGWKDGIETLIIRTEYANSGSASPAAWVVPVPATPEVFEAGRGVVDSARAMFTPRLDSSGLSSRLGLLILAMITIGVLHLIGAATDRLAMRLLTAASLFIMIAVVCGGLGRPRGLHSASQSVTIHTSVIVGAYDVTVVSSSEPDALRRWLTEFGVDVSKDTDAAITAYAKDGWRFVAAKLRETGAKGTLSPHPLGMRFAAASPVYPMRLTAVGNSGAAGTVGTPLELELLVFGPGTASVPGMRVVSSGWLDESDERARWLFPGDEIMLTHHGVARAASGCVWATRLAGSFTPAAMASDIAVTFGRGETIGRVAYAGSDRGSIIALWIMVPAALAGVVTLPFTWRRRWTLRRCAGVLATTAVLGAAASAVAVSRATFVRTESALWLNAVGSRIENAWWIVTDPQKPEDWPTTVEAACERFEKEWARLTEGVDSGERPTFGEGPGQYTIRAEGGELRFRWVNHLGIEVDSEVAIPLNRAK